MSTTSRHCETISFKNLYAIKSPNEKFEAVPKGMSVYLSNGTCFRASKVDPTLTQDFPGFLLSYNRLMQWMQEKFDASSMSDFCGSP
jgi:hypothetical protein